MNWAQKFQNIPRSQTEAYVYAYIIVIIINSFFFQACECEQLPAIQP